MPAIKPLSQSVLGAAIADILTTPPGVQPNSIVEVSALWIANTDTVIRKVTLRVGPAGALIAPNNSLGEAWPINPNTTWKISDGGTTIMTLRAGDHVGAFADVAGKVTITFYGQETSN